MENFIPELYSDMLLVQRPQETVFAKLCNTNYNGEIKNKGDRVHFTGIGRPEVYAYTKEQTLTAQSMSDYTVEMAIDQAYYFNVLLDDVDMKQGIVDIKPSLFEEARRSLSENMDAKIGLLYDQAGTTVTQTQVSSTNIISTIANGITQLYKNNVPSNEQLSLVVSPDVAEKIMLADIVFNTNNSDILSGGFIGKMKKFINCTVYVSNNVYSPSTVDYCMLFTNKAIGLAEQIPAGSIEKLRSTTKLADIIRGVQLFGAKVIKPKELVSLNLTTVPETIV